MIQSDPCSQTPRGGEEAPQRDISTCHDGIVILTVTLSMRGSSLSMRGASLSMRGASFSMRGASFFFHHSTPAWFIKQSRLRVH